jgi:hypothetical protein
MAALPQGRVRVPARRKHEQWAPMPERRRARPARPGACVRHAVVRRERASGNTPPVSSAAFGASSHTPPVHTPLPQLPDAFCAAGSALSSPSLAGTAQQEER